jgi:hypothetical protein
VNLKKSSIDLLRKVKKSELCKPIPDSLQRAWIETIPDQADFFQMYL